MNKNIVDKESKISLEEIKACKSMEEVLALQERIEMNLLDITGKLEIARASYFDTGNYADPIWYAKAGAYKRVLGFLHQQILQKKRELNYVDKAQQKKSFEQYFIEVAKEWLELEVYINIAHEARRRTNDKTLNYES